MEQQRNRKRKQREQERLQTKQEEPNEFKFNYASDEKFLYATKEFDKLNEQLVHKRCSCCRKVRLDIKVEQQTFANITHLLCCSCKNYNLNEIKQVQSVLPVWQNDQKQIQFQLPAELMDLREGEKLMIQKYSAYVPIHHLYKGQVGAKGHCCAFKQNVMDVSLVLPRKPADVKLIQVIKKYKEVSHIEGVISL